MAERDDVFGTIDETRNALREGNLIPLDSETSPKKKKPKKIAGISFDSRSGVSISKKKVFLSDAIKDINREIANLNTQKKKLNEQISSADKGLELSREEEKKLQEKIAKLMEKEADLKEKKKRILQEGETLTDKLSKIQKVKSELSDI